jgi:hypothetical protein
VIRAGLILAVLASPATAQQVAGAEGAVLRWLDKTTGETADIELSRGQTAQSGRLTILMDECRYPVDNPASNAFAHLTITESGRDGAVFSGWMVAASPALSALEHPRYDVWVLRCLTPDAPLIDVQPEPEAPDDATIPQEG